MTDIHESGTNPQDLEAQIRDMVSARLRRDAKERIEKTSKVLREVGVMGALADFSRRDWGGAGSIEPVKIFDEKLVTEYTIGYKIGQKFPWLHRQRRILRDPIITPTSGSVEIEALFYPGDPHPDEPLYPGAPAQHQSLGYDHIAIRASLRGLPVEEIPAFRMRDPRNLSRGISVPTQVFSEATGRLDERFPEDVRRALDILLGNYGQFAASSGVTAHDLIINGNRQLAEVR